MCALYANLCRLIRCKVQYAVSCVLHGEGLTGQIRSFGLPRVLTIISRVASSALAGNKGSCCRSSAMIQPTDHMSMASVYVSRPSRISGALQHREHFHRPFEDEDEDDDNVRMRMEDDNVDVELAFWCSGGLCTGPTQHASMQLPRGYLQGHQPSDGLESA